MFTSRPNRIINGSTIVNARPVASVEDIMAQGWTIVRVPFTAWGEESQAYVLSMGEKQAWLNSLGLVKTKDYRIIESQRTSNNFREFTVTYCWLFKDPKWANWFTLRWV